MDLVRPFDLVQSTPRLLSAQRPFLIRMARDRIERLFRYPQLDAVE